jgi:hypothetical protein
MNHYDLTGKKVSYFIDFITKEHTEPFSVSIFMEDFDASVINTLNISPYLVKCELTHCWGVNDKRFVAKPLGVKYHAKDIIGDWQYTKEKKLLLICQSENTNPQRKLFSDWAKNLSWVTFQYLTSPEHYFILLQQHQYVMCPSGYSIDSYRYYEALESGCIPVVDTYYYDQFPEYAGKYLKVNNFFDLTEEFLQKQLRIFRP